MLLLTSMCPHLRPHLRQTELYRHIGDETDVPAGDIGVGEAVGRSAEWGVGSGELG